MIRLCIVDDLPAVRQGLHMRLAAEADMTIVGEASDGDGALKLAEALCPDVVLMDVEMPRKDGIEATRLLRRQCPNTAVVMLSVYDDARTRARAEEAGAAGFVGKCMPVETLVAAIRQAAQRPSDAAIAPRPST